MALIERMDIGEAMRLARLGRRVGRRAWGDGVFVRRRDVGGGFGAAVPWFEREGPDGRSAPWRVEFGDLTADDWRELERPG